MSEKLKDNEFASNNDNYDYAIAIGGKDLLIYLYKKINLRYLIGKSIAWSNEYELVGRFTFAKSEEEINMMIEKLKKDLEKLV